jgi:2-polyprenyl-3-methyl-5-hydroxy-6-metoxy-1,4-benzoquinol methylase
MEFEHKLVNFECNVCEAQNRLSTHEFNREGGLCSNCNSNVRLRSIIHLLSISIFGESFSLPKFPVRRNLAGIGMSDWEVYAKKLKTKFSYTNTYYHQEPRLDISQISNEIYDSVDFIISSDVFEHIKPPVNLAFKNSYNLLKNNGVFIFSVPFVIEGETLEHFPDLHSYHIELTGNRYVLKNTTRNGQEQIFKDLIFHGGPGSTLEMRIFSKNDIIMHLQSSGFSSIEFFESNYSKWGIIWENKYSLPLIARK